MVPWKVAPESRRKITIDFTSRTASFEFRIQRSRSIERKCLIATPRSETSLSKVRKETCHRGALHHDESSTFYTRKSLQGKLKPSNAEFRDRTKTSVATDEDLNNAVIIICRSNRCPSLAESRISLPSCQVNEPRHHPTASTPTGFLYMGARPRQSASYPCFLQSSSNQ